MRGKRLAVGTHSDDDITEPFEQPTLDVSLDDLMDVAPVGVAKARVAPRACSLIHPFDVSDAAPGAPRR
ncbi:MAG: hypothetical protein AB7P03_08115 [Kofleriaceae bacterium]